MNLAADKEKVIINVALFSENDFAIIIHRLGASHAQDIHYLAKHIITCRRDSYVASVVRFTMAHQKGRLLVYYIIPECGIDGDIYVMHDVHAKYAALYQLVTLLTHYKIGINSSYYELVRGSSKHITITLNTLWLKIHCHDGRNFLDREIDHHKSRDVL